MKKTNETKTPAKKTPTYVRVVAAVLAGLMVFSVIATVIMVLASQHVH